MMRAKKKGRERKVNRSLHSRRDGLNVSDSVSSWRDEEREKEKEKSASRSISERLRPAGRDFHSEINFRHDTRRHQKQKTFSLPT